MPDPPRVTAVPGLDPGISPDTHDFVAADSTS